MFVPAAAAADDEKIVIWTSLTAEAQMKILTKQFNEVAEEMGVEVEISAVSLDDLYTKMAIGKETGDAGHKFLRRGNAECCSWNDGFSGSDRNN